ncbi:MAG: sigma-70 family RNA polymerase sigma factor [Desulfuromonadales bacterium]|nr:sigma-70 family RNA polymerase sigma factor [Desulfuromonadales bacterium]
MNEEFLTFINSCIAGDSQSWNDFFSKYGSLATKTLNRYFSKLSSDEKDDIIQNILVKLLNNGLKNFKGTTKYEFLAYFKQITIREASSYVRSTKHRKEEISIDQEIDFDDGNVHSAPDLVDNTFRPDKAAEIRNLLEKTQAKLSIEDWRILIYKIQEYTDKEIADMLGIPMGTVASRYNRIKIKPDIKKIFTAILLLIIFGRK